MLFDTSVRRELARTFGATMVVIVTIVMTMFLVRMLGQAARGQVAPQDVMLLMGYVALAELPTVLALSLFAAVVVTIGRMYRDSEMAIWFAAGIGLSRFVRPVLRTAWPVLLVIALLVVFARPWSQRASADLRENFEQRSDLSRVAPGVFQSSRDGSRVFFVESHSERDADARNVFVLSSRSDRESVTTALAGRLETDGERRYLVLEQGQQNDTRLASGEMTVASFERYRMLVSERAVQRVQERPAREQWSHELLRNPRPREQGELAWRLGLVFGAVNLLLLAVGLSASDPRRPSNWNLAFALLGFVVYYNLISLTQAWVAGGRMGFGVAVFGLHGAVFALALALIWWRENAAVARLRLRGS